MRNKPKDDECSDTDTNTNNDGNGNEDIGVTVDGEWDMTSPLLALNNDTTTATNTTGNTNDNLFSSNNNQAFENGEQHYHQQQRKEEDDEEEIPAVVSKMEVLEYYQTLLAALFTMTFIMLVSGSYFFEWSDTVLRVKFNKLVTNTDDLESSSNSSRFSLGEIMSVNLPLYTNATFQTTFGIFQSSHSSIVVFLIIVSAIAAPALYMILQPILICIISTMRSPFSSSSSSVENNGGSNISDTNSNLRRKKCVSFIYNHARIGQVLTILELTMKFSMAMIFVNSILSICTSRVKFIMGGDYGPSEDGHGDNYSVENENSIHAYVVNDARGGLISYLVGISFFGIGSLAMIRKLWKSRCHQNFANQYGHHYGHHQHQPLYHNNGHSAEDDDAVLLALNNGSGAVLSAPPPSAFSFRDHPDYFMESSSQSVLSKDDSMIGVLSMDDGLLKDDGSVKFYDEDDRTTEEHMTPLLPSGNNGQTSENGVGNSNVVEGNLDRKKQNRPPILDIIQFECGLLSFLLLLPISTLPLIRLEYTGVLTTLLDTSTLESTSLSLWDIAYSIISTNNYGRDIFGLVSIAFFWINVIIVPIITWTFCTIIWIFTYVSKRESQAISILLTNTFSLLKIFQPFAFMMPFAMGLFVTVSSLHLVSDFLFNQNSTCEMIQSVFNLDEVDGECMIIKGHLLPGSYFLLIQSIFNEVFVVLVTSMAK
jgi:hypothetical protein